MIWKRHLDMKTIPLKQILRKFSISPSYHKKKHYLENYFIFSYQFCFFRVLLQWCWLNVWVIWVANSRKVALRDVQSLKYQKHTNCGNFFTSVEWNIIWDRLNFTWTTSTSWCMVSLGVTVPPDLAMVPFKFGCTLLNLDF